MIFMLKSKDFSVLKPLRKFQSTFMYNFWELQVQSFDQIPYMVILFLSVYIKFTWSRFHKGISLNFDLAFLCGHNLKG